MSASTPPKPAIRDAASLFVVDDRGDVPRVLVGRRAAGHVFMAGKTVFPGGRVDPEDSRLARRFSLTPPAHERLCAATGRRFTANRSTAIALAAIREGFEETGIMIGRPGAFTAPAPAWLPFEQQSICPAPELLIPVARAITPPGLVRRFDARFFAVNARHIAWRTPVDALPSNELSGVAWMSFDELRREPLAEITQLILAALIRRIEDKSLFDPTKPMLLHRHRQKQFQTLFI